jgi:hypothetical protein
MKRIVCKGVPSQGSCALIGEGTSITSQDMIGIGPDELAELRAEAAQFVMNAKAVVYANGKPFCACKSVKAAQDMVSATQNSPWAKFAPVKRYVIEEV